MRQALTELACGIVRPSCGHSKSASTRTVSTFTPPPAFLLRTPASSTHEEMPFPQYIGHSEPLGWY